MNLQELKQNALDEDLQELSLLITPNELTIFMNSPAMAHAETIYETDMLVCAAIGEAKKADAEGGLIEQALHDLEMWLLAKGSPFDWVRDTAKELGYEFKDAGVCPDCVKLG